MSNPPKSLSHADELEGQRTRFSWPWRRIGSGDAWIVDQGTGTLKRYAAALVEPRWFSPPSVLAY